MREAVRREMVENSSNKEEAQKDYETVIKIIEGENIEGISLEDIIKKYELKTKVPYAVQALAGFRDGQKEAFRDILQATVENNGEVKEKSAGYAQELQTAGGKSIIGLFSVLALRANPNVENKENKFITWLTNEDSNAEDLYNHINFVFGDTFGKVEVISQANVQQWQQEGTLREKLDNAGVLVGTYSSWGSLFSETMAGLVSYSEDAEQEIKDQVNHNKDLLKGAGIELEETTLSDGKTVKVQFKNAKDSAKAIQLLIAEGQGLDRVNLPLERISQLVADELDYAATIPASALASAAGKFNKEYGIIGYYEALLEGAEIKAEDYAYLGVTEDKLNMDKKLIETSAGRKVIHEKINNYRTLSNAVKSAYNSTEDKKDKETIVSKVLDNEAVKVSMKKLGLSEQQLKDIVTEQYLSIRNLEVRTRLLGLSGKKIGVDMDGQRIDLAKMAKYSEGDKGTSAIAFKEKDGKKDIEGSTIKTIAAEDVQDGYRDNMINNIKSVLKGIMSKHLKEDKTAKSKESEEPILTTEQYEKALKEMITIIYEEYGDIFNSETEAREFLVTGMDALSLYTAKESGVGTGGYMVEKDKDGKAQNIYITNNGLPMKSLNMPGMWTIELMEGCDNINKPSLETFISSKEALAAFEWSVGFSGTFSSSVRTLLKDLDYAKIGGSMPDTMKVGVTTALTQTQGEIAQVIAQARKKLNRQGIAGVDLIMTANFDGTTQMVNELQKNGVRRKEIVSLSLDLLDSELKKLSDERTYPSADVAKVMEEAGVEDFDIDKLSEVDISLKIKVLQEVLKNVMKKGEVSYIVGDVSLLGRGWNPGDMGGAVEKLKEGQDHSAAGKVQATMWKVNFEKMDATQSEQGDGRFAHRDGKSRFSSEFFNRDIIQITSVESVRENKILREAATKEGGYSVDLILNNLNDVMEANEESTLQKANNAVVNETKQWAKKQEVKGNNAPTYKQAKEQLANEIGEDAAEEVMNKILEISRVRVGNDEEKMTRESWYAYDNYERYVAAANEIGIEPNSDIENAKVQRVMNGDTLAALELIKDAEPKAKVDNLINAVRNINDNYTIQIGKVTALYQGLSQEDKATIGSMNSSGMLGKIKGAVKVLFSSDLRTLMKENKKLNKYEQDFEKANKELNKKIDGDTGLEFNSDLGKVMFKTKDITEEVFDKAKGLDKEGKEIITDILNAITSPDKETIEVKAIAGMLGKESGNDMNIQDLSELFEITNIKAASNNEIMNKIMNRMLEIRKEGGDTAATELSIELTAVAGGLLLAMKAQEVETVGDLDQSKINGNQKTISEVLKVEYKNNFAKSGADDFVINVSQLRKAVKEEGRSYTAEARKNILDALAGNDGKIMEKDKDLVVNLFRNVHAIAASA